MRDLLRTEALKQGRVTLDTLLEARLEESTLEGFALRAAACGACKRTMCENWGSEELSQERQEWLARHPAPIMPKTVPKAIPEAAPKIKEPGEAA